MDEERFQVEISNQKKLTEAHSVIFSKIVGEERKNIMFVRSFLNITSNMQLRVMDERR